MVSTQNITDGAGEPHNPERKFTMHILCNEDNGGSFLLTPKHGKPVIALALVNRITLTELYADTIEQLTEEEAATLSTAIDVEMTLADELVRLHEEQDGNARENDTWEHPRTPLNGNSCRMLGRSPTDTQCPPLNMRKCERLEDH